MAAKKKTKEQPVPQLPMPMATAVWLFDNTTFTYEQISAFTELPMMSVEAIADGDMGFGIKGRNPVEFGEMSQEDLDKAQKDESFNPSRSTSILSSTPTRTKGPRYTPISKRSDKPNAIAWIVKNHPDITDPQIIKLVGTTKPTIKAVREKTHANIQNITPQNPADLGLCSWKELDAAIAKVTKQEEGTDSGSEGAQEVNTTAQDDENKDPISGFDFANFMPNRQGT